MSVQAIQLGEAFVKLTADSTELNRGVAKATTLLDRFGNLSMQAAKVATAAWATLGATIGATATHFAMVGDQLDKMSLRTGIGVKSLSELGYVAGQYGAALEDIHDLMWPLAEKIQRNDEALVRLSLSLHSLQSLSPEKQFYAVVDALGRLESHSEQAAAATEIFGGAGEKLLPMLKQGVGGIEKLREEARRLGFVMDSEGAAKAAALTDAYDNMNRATLAVSQNVGMVFAPFVTKAANQTADLCASISRFVQESPNVTSSLADVAVNLTKLSGGLVAVYGGLAAFRYGWTLASSTLLAVGGSVRDLGNAFKATLASFVTGGRVVEDFRRSMSAAAIASEYLTLHQMRNAGALTTNAAALQFMSVAEIQATIKTKTAAFFRSLFTRTTLAGAVATEKLAATMGSAAVAEMTSATAAQNHQLIILRQSVILRENVRLLAARAAVLQLQGTPLRALAKSQSTALDVSRQFQKAETALVPILQASSTALTTNAAANTITISARRAHTLTITQQTAAQNMQRASLLKSVGAIAAQKAASLVAAVANGLWSATTWAAAAAAKGLSFSLVALSIAWNTNPIGLIITGLLALGGGIARRVHAFWRGVSSDALCPSNDKGEGSERRAPKQWGKLRSKSGTLGAQGGTQRQRKRTC
ncbi:MAG: hypothetical protein Q4D38_14035 [Planctomycetia bacterium]|nr:hypothetical protein [Planctomycetia bacterium]